MKKNGRKYRKLQKEKNLKRKTATERLSVKIDQRIRGINFEFLSVSQIILANPIVNDNAKIKSEYIGRLKSYLAIICGKTPLYENAVIALYEKLLSNNERAKKRHEIGFYKYFILFDLIHILGYKTDKISQAKLDKVKNKYLSDFPNRWNSDEWFQRIIRSVRGSTARLTNLEKNEDLANEVEYIGLIKRNLRFMRKEPYGIVVTANMSAGKSTFINALTGKRVSLTRTMACTGKVHTIINKSYEDGFSYEYDHDLSLDAGSDRLLNDNEHNLTDTIVAAVHFNGILGKERIIVNDSPGVNFSGNEQHKLIADKLIKDHNYNLLIYVMNATQLATDDENAHLEFVKKAVGNIPVLFIINKIDSLIVEEDDIQGIIYRQTKFLEKKGFKDPIVCPVSAKAGYLSKKFVSDGLSKIEEREIYNYVDKFDRMKLTDYYAKSFKSIKIPDPTREEERLLKICGFAYVERIIKSFITGGQINGTGLR